MRLTMIVANDIKNRTEDLITSSNVICAIFTSQISSLWQVTLAMGFGKITQSPIFEDMLAIFDSRQNIPSYPCLELYKSVSVIIQNLQLDTNIEIRGCVIFYYNKTFVQAIGGSQ